jgi:hypothetical protein
MQNAQPPGKIRKKVHYHRISGGKMFDMSDTTALVS